MRRINSWAIFNLYLFLTLTFIIQMFRAFWCLVVWDGGSAWFFGWQAALAFIGAMLTSLLAALRENRHAEEWVARYEKRHCIVNSREAQDDILTLESCGLSIREA